MNIDPGGLDGEDRRRYVVDMATALIDELGEARAEINWKPWTTDNTFNREAYLKELVDAFHFLMNLILVADIHGPGILADEFAYLYFRKREVNVKRHEDGYDGHGTKCSQCGRDVVDSGLLLDANMSTGVRNYRCLCGREVTIVG